MAATTVFLLAYVAVTGTLMSIFLCGDASSNSYHGKLTHFVTDTMPKTVRATLLKIPIVGTCCVPRFSKAINYMFYQRNPIMQIFYILLIHGGSMIYFIKYSHMVPNKIVGPIHAYLPYPFLGILTLAFYRACTSDPGFITKENYHKYDHQPYDGFLYVKTATCKTMKWRKIARSKYCKFCNKTVATFDHFCPWLNNAVGEDNYRYFLSMLCATIAYLLYAVFVLGGTIYSELLEFGFFNQKYFYNKRLNKQIKMSNLLMIQYTMVKYPLMAGLTVLCGIMSFVVLLFFFYHLYLIYQGTTTNESMKWDSVDRFYRNRKKLVEKNLKEIETHKAEGNEVITLDKDKLLDPDVAPALNKRMPVEYPEKKPRNIYKIGFFKNMLRVLAPMAYQNPISEVSKKPIARKKLSKKKKKKNN